MRASDAVFTHPSSFDQTFPELYGYGKDKMVRNVTFLVTEQCNLRCTYCYEGHKSERRMAWETAKQGVDMLLDDSLLNGYFSTDDSCAVILDFMGGEPLLETDLIQRTVAYFKSQTRKLGHPWAVNWMTSISSNGLLYFDERFRDFCSVNDMRVSLTLSIDGHKELHDRCRVDQNGIGSYDRIIDAIKHFIARTPQSNTKVTFSHDSLPHICDAIMHLYNLGYKHIAANTVFEDVWQEGDDDIFLTQLMRLANEIIDNDLYLDRSCTLFSRTVGHPIPDGDDKNACGGAGNMLAIGVDGALYPCFRYIEFARVVGKHPAPRIGNVWEGIDASHPILQDFTCITRTSQSPHECLLCSEASGCTWCTAYNYDVFGTPNKRTTYHCKMHKARAAANRYFWDKLHRRLGYDLEQA